MVDKETHEHYSNEARSVRRLRMYMENMQDKDHQGYMLAGLPQAARAYIWARRGGPSILLAPRERMPLYRDVGVFGAAAWFNPGIEQYGVAEKVAFDYEEASRELPASPDDWRLVLQRGKTYKRQDLLEKLHALGYEREETYQVKGETVIIGDVRAEFFGEEIESLFVAGKPQESAIINARKPLRDVEKAPALKLFGGPAFIDTPATLPQELWPLLEERELITFGVGGPTLPSAKSSLIPLPPYHARLKQFKKDVVEWLKKGWRVALVYEHDKTRQYIIENYLQDMEYRLSGTLSEKSGLQLLPGRFAGGFLDEENRLVLLTEQLLFSFGGAWGSRSKVFSSAKRPQDPGALTAGDYLIHPEHGIGLFRGIVSREALGAVRDYLELRYAGEGRLFVPVEQLYLLRRHPATSDEPPKLSSLGKKAWQKAKEKAQADAEALAQKLLVLHAKRRATKGKAYPAIPEWDSLIVDTFPHKLTEDQKRALQDTLRDLESPAPMDRLISGDVGFGKTEIALRAAHRVVGHGAQVVYLTPTTLLAEQHYQTFKERYRELPVEVAMLSRFTPEARAREALRGLAEGKVDIVIGTHRLLGEAVEVKRLGLLIVDEEHRFGVAQKERIKEMAANVDVLMLSATPIPRTLYQALVGLKDVSSIQTPPPGRKPINTLVAPYDNQLVRQAVLYELQRGGKTFYVHDRISSIEARARHLQRLLPEARIAVVHGQMPDRDIEEVMSHFARGAFDVLVATTIVESGLDIPEVNTIVIERADKLGLASLYQLRGRVGRRSQEAYAYLLHPRKLSEAAERRLAALEDLTDLGSGHRLAEKDMQIRGVGNILGPEQHGHIQAVSFEVYTELLAQAVKKLQGKEEPDLRRVSIDLAVSARLTPQYIRDAAERSRVYGKLAEAGRIADLVRLERSLKNSYGAMPQEVANLFALSRLRIVAEQRGVLSISEDEQYVQLVLAKWPIEYDAKGMRRLGVPVEETRYPPGLRFPKRRLAPEQYIDTAMHVIYQLG